MSVLIDTSVWVDHFRRRNDTLVTLLLRDEVLSHPLVLGELACGSPPAPRHRTPDARLWTLDKPLVKLAARFDAAFAIEA